jgi:hypothetical protein
MFVETSNRNNTKFPPLRPEVFPAHEEADEWLGLQEERKRRF